MVASGEVVVQQKASCFPALALAPPAGAHAIDGCAAPGNKTSHLAALMLNRGKVVAFEMNARRCDLLKESRPAFLSRLKEVGVSNLSERQKVANTIGKLLRERGTAA